MVSQQIVEWKGKLLGVDSANIDAEDPRFCLALDFELRWEPSVTVYNDQTHTKTSILIDYNYLRIRCWYCFDTNHRIRDCPSRLKQLKVHGTVSSIHTKQLVGRHTINVIGKQTSVPHADQLTRPPMTVTSPLNDDGFLVSIPKHKRKWPFLDPPHPKLAMGFKPRRRSTATSRSTAWRIHRFWESGESSWPDLFQIKITRPSQQPWNDLNHPISQHSPAQRRWYYAMVPSKSVETKTSLCPCHHRDLSLSAGIKSLHSPSYINCCNRMLRSQLPIPR